MLPDTNPLVDVRKTQEIRSVLIGGRLLDRNSLDDMLAQVEAIATGNDYRVFAEIEVA